MNQIARAPSDRILTSIRNVIDSLAVLSQKRPASAIFLSLQKRQFCTQEPRSISVSDIDFTVLPEVADVIQQRGHYDLCVLCCHNEGEEALLFELRRKNLANLYFAWMWDSHHHHLTNLRTAMLADVVFSASWQDHDYLSHPAVLCGVPMPAYSRQWSAQLIAQNYPDGLPFARADGIFGGFGRYQWLPERNTFIEQLMNQCPGHALSLLDADAFDAYFRLPITDRLKDWANYKVHLIVPVANDVSTRVFEALMTGQIPLVPDDVSDLNLIVPADVQRVLPILRYGRSSIESVQAAWRDGVARFDSEGAVGIARRHDFARDHHSLTARLRSFATFVRKPGRNALRSNGRIVCWVQPGTPT